MNIKPNWKRISLSLLLLALAFGSYTAYHVFAIPTGQTSSIEGGGFCDGTFTVFNNTIDNQLYAQNCATGINLGPSNDLGALWTGTIVPALTNNGGKVELRDGYFSVVTPIILCPACGATGRAYLGLTFMGSGRGDYPLAAYQIGPCITGATCGTLLVAKTAGMEMIQATPFSSAVVCTTSGCSGSANLVGYSIRDMTFVQNGKANVAMDLATGGTSAYATIDNVMTYTASVNGFKVGLNLNGYEDSWVTNSVFAGDGTSVANKVDVKWVSPAGNVNLQNDVFGGQINTSLCAQTVNISDSTVTSIAFNQNCLNSSQASSNMVYISGNYMANGQGAGRIQMNSTTAWGQVSFVGNYFAFAAPLILGPGTIKLISFCGNTFHNAGGAAWSSGAPTLTEQKSCGNNALQNNDSNITGSPFTPDGNGVF